MDKLIETFCDVDDFCQLFIEQWQQQLIEIGELKRRRSCKLSPAEIMTILIHFHQSHYRDFKSYYLLYVCRNLTKYFPNLLSYTRFLGMTASVVVPMCSYLTSKLGKPTGIQFVVKINIDTLGLFSNKWN